jgi:asparagine synthase (glutamine-hydrolysing)
MCGIAGFAGDFDRSSLGRMSAALRHRGPDDGGDALFAAGGSRVGLATRRLAILDLTAAGHQPMTLQCPICCAADAPDAERIWVSFNGEIYNYPDLKNELTRAGHRFVSQSDTEVLLHLYAAYGPDMLSRLNGMFALAVYDGRPRGQHGGMRPGDVLLARDGLGVKPLYYTASRRGVLFASEMKALLASASRDVDRQLDPVAVNQYLAYQWVPAPRTVLASIRKVLPGECLILRRGRIVSTHTFYRLPVSPAGTTKQFDELVVEFRDRLRQAVSRQLVADVPIGAFLSGGLDSSAVVAMVRHAEPTYPLPCYTMAFDDDVSSEGGPSDLPYALAVARHLNVDVIPVHADAGVVNRLEEVLHALDEPTGDPAPINAYLIAERAHADGLKVLLSGTGGDDLFGGYGRHLWLPLEPLWDALPLSARRPVAAWARETLDAGGGARPFAARRLLKLLAQFDRERAARLAERLQSTSRGLRAQLLHESIRGRLADASDMVPLLQTLSTLPRSTDALTMMLHLDQRHFLGDHNLNYLDKTTMAFSVEGRVPLLDRELVEFAAGIPPRWKVSGLRTKFIFRKAMEPFLPHDAIYRPKAGFGVPLRQWMRRDLRELVNDLLSPSAVRSRGVFDESAVRRLADGTQNGSIDGAYPLFSILAFEVWCRACVDATSSSSVAALVPQAARA